MEQEFLGSEDISLQTFNEVLEPETSIKREEMKDEDDILLFAQLDNITNNLAANSNDFHLGQNMDRMEEAANLMQSAYSNIRDKPPVDLAKNVEPKIQPNDGNGSSHYVKYKLQDGKHVKVWECGVCSKEFTHQYTLMRHLPTHTDERKFQCNTCGKGNLRNHIFTHTNERPYKCDICEKGFNQMSNLMCHKLKAHQRTEKPKYVCQICDRSFPKRMGLRHHEQFSHGMVNPPAITPQIMDKNSYSNAIVVDTIKTEAMRLAIESNQTPFALLRPLAGIPVLVRVLPAGDRQMLVPATAEDLKKHSHISITPKSENDKENIDKATDKHVGSTVQIKIPVVATVVQQNDLSGHMSMSIVSPGPNGELGDQSGMIDANISNFVYSSTLTNHEAVSEHAVHIEDIPLSGGFEASDIIGDVNIEFLDEHGRRIGEKGLAGTLEGNDSNSIILEENAVNIIQDENSLSDEKIEPLLTQNTETSSAYQTPKVVICDNFFEY